MQTVMKVKEEEKEIYIVLTQTGTILSRILKAITNAQYNHSSISLEDDLSTMYSFGRLFPYNPFIGGFVKESTSIGTFKRFYNTEATVLRVSVPIQKHKAMKVYLTEMYKNKKQYHYNYPALFLALFGIVVRKRNAYYCSEFVRDFLIHFDVVPQEYLPSIVKPVDFFKISNSEKIYTGKLREYKKPPRKKEASLPAL
ncbi:MAG: hypothetical protein UD936_07935, partial [Acutalibacteraceae bacterium]|nr:hypothetical protein [Acutalibacteraceae bacterium]